VQKNARSREVNAAEWQLETRIESHGSTRLQLAHDLVESLPPLVEPPRSASDPHERDSEIKPLDLRVRREGIERRPRADRFAEMLLNVARATTGLWAARFFKTRLPRPTPSPAAACASMASA
jgi:hypothetical protein